jgi:hypothetical protein
MSFPSNSRIPRARLDAIVRVDQALAVFRLAMCHPLRPETLVMFLDKNNYGHELVSVSGTTEPFHVIDVASTMALCATGNDELSSLVLATVRPGGGLLPGDDELWFETAHTVEESGLVLIDWLVIGRGGAQSPREMLGIPSRWAAHLDAQ